MLLRSLGLLLPLIIHYDLLVSNRTHKSKTYKEIKMNTLKVTKWLGFALLGLVMLSIPLALAGLWAARDFQGWSSQVKPVQSEGKQIDVVLPGQKVAQTAPDTGKDPGECCLVGDATKDHKSRRRRHIAVVDPNNGQLSPAGDPTTDHKSRRRRHIAAVDPVIDQLTPAGGITAIDPTNGGYLSPAGGINALDPTNGGHLSPAGWIAGIDPTNGGHISPAGYARTLDPSGWIQR
jgi:hypothetical protein